MLGSMIKYDRHMLDKLNFDVNSPERWRAVEYAMTFTLIALCLWRGGLNKRVTNRKFYKNFQATTYQKAKQDLEAVREKERYFRNK